MRLQHTAGRGQGEILDRSLFPIRSSALRTGGRKVGISVIQVLLVASDGHLSSSELRLHNTENSELRRVKWLSAIKELVLWDLEEENRLLQASLRLLHSGVLHTNK